LTTDITRPQAAQIVDEAQKPKRQADLEKARSILDRRQKGQSVSWVEIEWTKTLCAREAKLEGAEMKDVTATDMKKQQWQQDQERKIQEISGGATPEPARVSQKKSSAREPEDDNGGSEKKDEDNAVSQTQVSLVICVEDTHTNNKQPQDPLSSPLSDVNNNMTAERNAHGGFDVDIWDDDVWALMIKAD
jgi:hypothetical protein